MLACSVPEMKACFLFLHMEQRGQSVVPIRTLIQFIRAPPPLKPPKDHMSLEGFNMGVWADETFRPKHHDEQEFQKLQKEKVIKEPKLLQVNCIDSFIYQTSLLVQIPILPKEKAKKPKCQLSSTIVKENHFRGVCFVLEFEQGFLHILCHGADGTAKRVSGRWIAQEKCKI
jgi:hypothetical protein